ncbi:hypothetical protein B0H13DRAFT_2239539 [Mycena leptocephala]|nr:hypothetical protein B0H13DRAFT_2239539 [Mycena leptocephala]
MFSEPESRGQLDKGHSPYNYTPTRWICFMFVSLFGLSTCACLHLTQAIMYRLGYMFPTTVLCGLLEVLGIVPSQLMSYELQIPATISGAIPLLAANFLTLGKVVDRLGARYCRLAPHIYSALFLTCDLIALVVQGAGGGLASVAGGHIMLVGISAYDRLIASSDYNTSKDTMKPVVYKGTLTPHLRLLVWVLALNTVCLIVRAIYRIIELLDGFQGRIISKQ